MNYMKRIGMLVIMAVMVVSLPQWAAASDEQHDTISLSGTAHTEMAPDMATLYIKLEGKADTAAEARTNVAVKLQSLKGILLGELITSEDVSATSYNLSPVYNDKGKLTGYEANSTIAIKVKNLQRLGNVIDKCVDKAECTVDSVQFGLQDPGKVERELLGTATQNAAEKARIIAEAGGRTLGVLVNASVGGDVGAERVNASNKMISMSTADVASGKNYTTELMPGTIGISVTVYTVFSLK